MSQVSDKPAAGLLDDLELYLRIYRQMLLIRGFEDLVQSVSKGMAEGKSLAELQKTLLFEKYKDWSGYEQRRAPTIESAYNNLKIYR